MKYFKEMVKLARETGVFGDNLYDTAHAAEAFWQVVPKNEIFVFSGHATIDDPETIPESEFGSLDAPFPVFSIELADGPLARTPPDLGNPQRLKGLAGTDLYCAMVCEIRTLAESYLDKPMTRWVASDEVGLPHGYLEHGLVIFCLAKTRYEDGQVLESVMKFSARPGKNSRFFDLFRLYLDRLQVERDGLEEVPDVVMLPSGKGGKKKKPHPIRRVFHITPKSKYRTYTPGPGRHVDWTHRWGVRGHWVYYKGRPDLIGKNRTGEYVERGRTWRSEHEKGPEDKELIKKLRIVDEART